MLKVLVAEDMHVVRAGLVSLLDAEFGIEVVAHVASGDAVVPAAIEHRADVAVLDIGLPGLDGLSAAEALKARVPRCRALMLTGLDRSGYLRRALAAGIPGFLLKSTTPKQLAEGIRTVATGGRVVDPALLHDVWTSAVCPLTEREAEILRMVGDGADAREIAVHLFLSVGTVRNRLSSAMSKLHARTQVDAVRIAERQDWI
ncbi:MULTISPECIES: response regulator transcription factor [Streptomyces]|uniref:Response regulator n=1 Tax=Streptomyces yanii TaxID=78510 RepID=A0ABV5RHU0_9ACTN